MAKRRRPQFDVESYSSSTSAASSIIQQHHTYEPTPQGIASTRLYVDIPATTSTEPDELETASAWTTDFLEPPMEALHDDSFLFDSLEPTSMPDPIQSEKRRRTLATDNPLKLWEPEIDIYLRELLRLEAPDSEQCSRCHSVNITDQTPLYRCSDCWDTRLLCSACIVHGHAMAPFHRVKMWNGGLFSNANLKALGLRIQLGHSLGAACSNPVPAFNDDFVILHINGIHRVALDFCGCVHSAPRNIQLIRSFLFPATTIDPKTATTFFLLEYFQLLSFMSKVSAFEFYQTLVRRTDNTGAASLPDRYASFLRMIREWRHLKMLKRAGRGHDPAGVKGTRPGECAVLCPACPLPGINLPPGWNKAPEHERWLYSLFIGIDANFRLKRLKVSSTQQDPGLNHGYAYFVEDRSYKAYLEEYGPRIPDDTSTCSNHDAIKSASIRGGKGIDASGVGKVECARHDMKRPVSVGDLQKGERYVNMDYFFLSSLMQNAPNTVVVSYDIVCQWARNLAQRRDHYAPSPFGDIRFIFVVPKFHLAAHRPECHVSFSFNYTSYVGRTDGEAPERGWAAINAVSTSTKEMGPGSRRDTLDDHFGDYNWRKVVTLASTFLRKIREAVVARSEHVEAFVNFDASLPKEDTAMWTRMVQAWELDGSRPNPFAAKVPKISENAVRLELAAEDAAQLRDDLTSEIHEDVPPSRLIAQGLELEDHQRLLRADLQALGPHATNLQRSKVIERSNRLWRKIEAWTSIQQLYMPGVAVLRARAEKAGGEDPPSTVNIDLLLPSEIIGRTACDTKYMEYEWRLRYAQAYGTLYELRRAILLRSQMFKSKDKLIRGQRMQTRSLGLISSVSSRITRAAQKYRQIRDALVKLSMRLHKVGWETTLQSLQDSDLRGLTAGEDDVSEGRRTMSWIWTTAPEGEGIEGEGKLEALRIEWCKARARAHRWQEECLLLSEEMRRVIAFFDFQENRWRILANTFSTANDPRTAAGMAAYALRQADIRRRMRLGCQEAWKDVPALVQTGMGAADGSNLRVECH